MEHVRAYVPKSLLTQALSITPTPCRYLLDNIFCGYIDHYGQWDPRFAGKSYARVRNFETGEFVANVVS